MRYDEVDALRKSGFALDELGIWCNPAVDTAIEIRELDGLIVVVAPVSALPALARAAHRQQFRDRRQQPLHEGDTVEWMGETGRILSLIGGRDGGPVVYCSSRGGDAWFSARCADVELRARAST